jgi:hypothetical protein
MPVAEYLQRLDDDRRLACEAVLSYLEDFDEVIVEAAEVGLLIKRGRTFAELRPKRGRMELTVKLHRPLDHPRIRRSVQDGRRFYHFIDLRTAADVDDDVRGWLAESYAEFPG